MGDWNLSECYIQSIAGTTDPTAIYTISAAQFNSMQSLTADNWPITISFLQAAGVGSLNGLQKNVQIAAGTGIGLSIDQAADILTITNTGTGGGGGSASTIYIQELADDVPGEGFLQSTRGGRAYLGVAMGVNESGGVIQGVNYITASTSEQVYGFAMRMPTSIGGSAVTYSDLTFRVSMPTFTNVTIPVSNTTNNQFYIEPVLVNASYWTSGDPYARAAQFPLLTAASGDGTSWQPIHSATFGAITTSGGNSVTISSISGGYWTYTVSPNTAYTGTNTDWIVLWAISPGLGGFNFNITGDPTGSQFQNNGDIEVDLAIGSGGSGSTPSLAQVLAVGNTVGTNNISLTGGGKLSGAVTALNITGGSNGQVLTTDGAGTQSWTNPGANVLDWGDFVTVARYNSGVTPVTGVSVTFTTPSATVTGTVHYYNRLNASNVATPIYRFVPNTDSAVNMISYDSFWSGFTTPANTLSGLLAQRGIF